VLPVCEAEELFARIRDDEPRPLSDARPEVPIPISRLVMRCLAKDPKKRFQQAREVVRLIETLASPATTDTTG
jgi:hypothetical protein